MSCSIATPEEIEEELARLSGSGDMKIAPKKQDTLIRLPRGGILIKTLMGNLQFGMPPETVKDCMILGLDVPTYFVLPTKRFDFGVCLNVAEFEFPAYFNFFIRKKQVTLICDKESEKAIRTVFQETLLGPENFENFHEEFSEEMDKDAIPDIAKELKHFCKNPFKPTEPLTVETLVSFINFDEKGVAKISEEVSVQKMDGTFNVSEKGKVIAIIPDAVEIVVDEEEKEYQEIKKAEIDKMSELNMQDLRGGFKVENLKPILFVPPLLGVTILGNSHGFDPKGSTSGYIIWVNGRGVLVDPPPFATYRLKKLGIPDSLIEWVIISHCHGDHDAGAFQKILDTDKVEVITTPTIMGSFLKKYSAITGMNIQQLSALFKFRPVTIGSPCYINGGSFKFFYSLHSIPAIGFEVHYKSKSIYFSADTFYYPEKMEEMVKNGVLTEKRYHDLVDNKWNHDLILHEAGVPPIHTPIAILSTLPQEIKEKIYLVHVSEIPVSSGLKAAPVGIEKTITLIKDEGKDVEMINILDIICTIEMFQHTPLRSLRDLIQSASIETFKEGDIIFKEGEQSDKFFIILKGITRIFCDNPSYAFERFYQMGDYFGESVVLKKDTKRTASVAAFTDVTLLSLRRNEFLFIFGANNQIMDKMSNLYQSRQKYCLKAIRKNTLFSTIASSQKIQVESICQSREYHADDVLWKKGDTPSFVFLVYKGSVQVIYDSKDYKEEEDNTDEFTSGTFIGETNALLNNGTCKITVIASSNLHIFAINKKEYLSFLEINPKLMVNLAVKEVIE